MGSKQSDHVRWQLRREKRRPPPVRVTLVCVCMRIRVAVDCRLHGGEKREKKSGDGWKKKRPYAILACCFDYFSLDSHTCVLVPEGGGGATGSLLPDDFLPCATFHVADPAECPHPRRGKQGWESEEHSLAHRRVRWSPGANANADRAFERGGGLVTEGKGNEMNEVPDRRLRQGSGGRWTKAGRRAFSGKQGRRKMPHLSRRSC